MSDETERYATRLDVHVRDEDAPHIKPMWRLVDGAVVTIDVKTNVTLYLTKSAAHALARACGEAEFQAEASPAARAALLDPLQTALDAVLSDIAAWRHELALRSLKG